MDVANDIAPVTKIPPVKDSFYVYLSVILSFLLAISIVVIIYLIFQNINLSRKFATFQASQTQLNSPSPVPSGKALKNNALVSIDSVWDLYTNNELGLSMKIPKNMYHGYGACQWNDSEKSYRPKLESVPVAVFELTDRVFISSKYFYELGGETVVNDTHFFSQCNKVDNSITKLQDKNSFQEQDWEIIKGNIQSEVGLDGFIKDNYGPGCKVGEKKPTTQNGIFDITIDNGGYSGPAEAATHGCLVNYIYVLKYSPERSKAFTWKLGMSTKFPKTANWDAYDTEMADSFKFID
jgi:hypothetical protein